MSLKSVRKIHFNLFSSIAHIHNVLPQNSTGFIQKKQHINQLLKKKVQGSHNFKHFLLINGSLAHKIHWSFQCQEPFISCFQVAPTTFCFSPFIKKYLVLHLFSAGSFVVSVPTSSNCNNSFSISDRWQDFYMLTKKILTKKLIHCALFTYKF